ncbi:MAG: hypothetical protein ABSF66_06560 [Terriglobales bacterium]|jgi:hypothetical protein
MSARPHLVEQSHPASRRERDFAPEYVETPRMRLTPGLYTMRCIAVRPRHMFGAHKLELKFQMPGTNDFVFGYLHLGRGPEPEVRPGSNYAKLWLGANDGKKARRMSASLFRWAWFECKVGDCTKTHEGKMHTQPYSVVTEILRFVQR